MTPMHHDERLNNDRILALASTVVPRLGGAILGRSPVEWDEDYWIGILHDADQQAGRVRSRSFTDFRDLMTILAHHDRHLIDGRDQVRAARASEALALHSQATSGNMKPITGSAQRFEQTLTLILESLGASADAVRPVSQQDSLPGIRSLVVDIEAVHARAEVWTSTGPKSDGMVISPLHSIRLENRSRESIEVETLRMAGEGLRPWSREGIRLGPGEVRVLEPHEVEWDPGRVEPGTKELAFSVGIPGRSRENTLTIEILRRGRISSESVPWLVAANIPTADPFIDHLLETVRKTSGAYSEADSDEPALIAALDQYLDSVYELVNDSASADGTVDLRTPHALSETDRLHASERAVLLAAAMERIGLSPFVLLTRTGLRSGWGTPDETTQVWTRSQGAIASILAKLTVPGITGRPEEVMGIIDLELARETIGPDRFEAVAGGTANPEVNGTGSVPAVISRWKKELLNLTFTNRQLRMSVAAGLRIPLPDDFLPDFVDLLSSGATFEFVPKSELITSTRGGLSDDAIREGLNRGVLCGMPLSTSFGTRMSQLSTVVRTARAESGMNILHAAIGLLDWIQDDKGKRGLSPIILVPLQLSGSARSGFRIALEAGATPSVNIALAEKLGLITGRRLAALDRPAENSAGLDIAEVLHSVATEVQSLPIDGRVLPEVRVMTSNHANAPMWKDLQENWRSFMSKPVTRHLVSGTGTRFIDSVPVRPHRPEDEYETPLVSRVDGPQLDAVVNASLGSSFVLEGPPGTGKSQTITNIIAAGISRGRKLLFVAEKKAALDVVLTRLREAGLSDLVLDLHDTKQSMNAVRDALKRSLRAEGRSLPPAIEAKQHSLARIISELNGYAGRLFLEHDNESLVSLFGSWTGQLAEFDRETGWQPEEIDTSMPLDKASVSKLKELIRGYRRATRARSVSDGHNESLSTDRTTRYLERLKNEGLYEVATELESGRDVFQLPNAIDLAAARRRLEAGVLSCELGSVSGSDRQRLVDRYLIEASELEQMWRENLSAAVIQRRNSEMGDRLSYDFIQKLARRTGGKVRTLFEEHGNEVLWSTPCVLMSPSGVSKHIPLGSVEFDTVIFDESSQIVPSTAIGALARANSAIFVGDRRQMPPPTEFLSSGDGDLLDELGEETGQNHVGRMKSILTLAASAGFEKKRLTWHYRSRDERLIEFSNQKFYEGTLTTIPSAPHTAGTHPVRLVYVGGEYVKMPGSGKGNPEEAEAVIAEVERIVATDPSKSIMVVTFNSTQRDHIENLLLESGNPSIRSAFDRESEPLTIKNVDNVQGDERDIVLFSTVYAPDKATGNLTQNFGPLNRPGGENRFNVAVTRARDRIVLFTSLKSADLDLRTSASKGLKCLKDYLRAAEMGSSPSVSAATDSGYHYREQVAATLTAQGLEVRKGVGASSFRVDLAVRRPGSSRWVAVLLDHEEWAKQQSVRDRDGIPKGNLDSRRGWSGVYRVLMPEWSMNPEKVVSEIVTLTELDEISSDAEPGANIGPGPHQEVRSKAISGPDGTGVSTLEDSSGEVPAAVQLTSELAPTRAVVYREAPVTEAGSRDTLLRAHGNLVARSAVRAQIQDILRFQGPTEISKLSRQVANRFGAVKLTAQVAQAVEVSIPGDVPTDPLARIVWPPNVSPESYREYRVPAEGAPARNFAEIGVREMSNAIVDVLAESTTFDMFGEEIEDEVSGIFGLTSSSRDSRSRIREALAFCLRSGVIEQDSQKRYFCPETHEVETESSRVESVPTLVVGPDATMSTEESIAVSNDNSEMSGTQLIWTEEEMILAADLADDRDWRGPNSATPEVLELSELLNRAHFYPHQGRPENFRSPSSVSRKVGNLIGSHPTAAPKKSLRTSPREIPIVQRFVEDRAAMKALAQSIRERIRRGEL
ncbi:MAG: DUF4011 domain-containing protein [Actinomycetota bacterium]